MHDYKIRAAPRTADFCGSNNRNQNRIASCKVENNLTSPGGDAAARTAAGAGLQPAYRDLLNQETP